MTVWTLAEWLGLTEAGIRVFEYSDWNEQRVEYSDWNEQRAEYSDWNEQRAATTGQGIVRMLAGCEELLKARKRSVSPDLSD